MVHWEDEEDYCLDYPKCDHISFEIGIDGIARCDDCDHRWYATKQDYDHIRRAEKRWARYERKLRQED
jgi:hypothetical protein